MIGSWRVRTVATCMSDKQAIELAEYIAPAERGALLLGQGISALTRPRGVGW
jgi:hypothetical protein